MNLKRSLRRLSNLWRPVRLVSPSSYEDYVATQNAGNRRKIDLVSARQSNIVHLAWYAEQRIGRSDLAILCHGTRNGAEQGWFKGALPQARVLGTEIADTAMQFPDTIQWDFHEVKPEWIGAWDVIYSNSWDHAFDPERAFKAWMSCLAADGLLFLVHDQFHTPAHATKLDPFGATLSALMKMIERLGWGIADVIDDLPDGSERRRVVVVSRSVADGEAAKSVLPSGAPT